MSGSTAHEIGLVRYPGSQEACILGLTDLFGVASTIALAQRRSGRRPLRVTHWQPLHGSDANLACVYDSVPRGSPKPRTLISHRPWSAFQILTSPPGWYPGSAIAMQPVLRWFYCARADSPLPQRVSSTGNRSPHIRFARRHWRSVFRKSSSM
jgi:hypothetical protein